MAPPAEPASGKQSFRTEPVDFSEALLTSEKLPVDLQDDAPAAASQVQTSCSLCPMHKFHAFSCRTACQMVIACALAQQHRDAGYAFAVLLLQAKDFLCCIADARALLQSLRANTLSLNASAGTSTSFEQSA